MVPTDDISKIRDVIMRHKLSLSIPRLDEVQKEKVIKRELTFLIQNNYQAFQQL